MGQIIQWDGDIDMIVDNGTFELFLENGTGKKTLGRAGIPVNWHADFVRLGYDDKMLMDIFGMKHFRLQVRLTGPADRT